MTSGAIDRDNRYYADRYNGEVAASHFCDKDVYLVVLDHPDGCTSVVVVHTVSGERVCSWHERELDHTSRWWAELMGKEYLFACDRIVNTLPRGCSAHTSDRWRDQHVRQDA